MPIGLRNAAQSFQRLIDQVFLGLDFVYAYVDDVLIASSNPHEYKLHLRQVFQRIEQYGITSDSEKCKFGQAEVDFLGHRIDEHGISLLLENTQSIVDYPVSQSIKNLHRCLGMLKYYCRFDLSAPSPISLGVTQSILP